MHHACVVRFDVKFFGFRGELNKPSAPSLPPPILSQTEREDSAPHPPLPPAQGSMSSTSGSRGGDGGWGGGGVVGAGPDVFHERERGR